MSRYKAYLEYKESNIVWMGAVPEGWNVIPCRAVVEDIAEKNVGAADQNYLSVMANIGVIKYEDKGDVGNKKPDDLSKCKIVKAGNLVINSMNYAIGSYGMSPYNGVCSPVYIVLGVNEEEMESRFALRIFENTPFQKYLATFGNGILEHRAAIGWDDIKGAHIAVPSKTEQIAILNFLDHETAKIDALIEKQQRLIELLKEKRQAVISYAVTKGLNPNAPMKDSGVEWLGEVPAHWLVTQLKFNTLEMQTGPFGSQLHSEDYVDGGIPLINPAHMIDGNIIPDSKVTVDEATRERLSRHILKAGELIFARRGELGRCAVVTATEDGWLCGTGSLKAKLNDRLIPEYSYLLITSEGVVSELSLESKGSTMDNLNTETLGRVRLPVPPKREQLDILEYVHLAAGKFKILINNADSAISLMRERRTALISAAVTGKIDVRDWQAAARHQLTQ
jgi:type I restriction enzyme S subunit